jgi:ABC-2 type transport system permease protein
MRFFSLIRVFIRGSFQKETAYRFNFAANLLNSILNLAGSLGGILVLFSAKESLNGWTFREVLTLTGVYLLIQALKNLVTAPSLNSLTGFSGELWTGNFDFILLKPIPPQFHISFKNWNLWSVLDILFAVGIILVSAPVRAGFPGPLSSVVFIAALAISMLLVYSILLLLGSMAFWYLGTPLSWIFDAFIQAGRFPVGIYPGAFRFFLTWLIPIGFVITMPAEILTGRADIPALAGGAALSVLLFFLSGAFFRASIRRYSSASS